MVVPFAGASGRARRAERGLVLGAVRGCGGSVAAGAERRALMGPHRLVGVHGDVAEQAEARRVLGAVQEPTLPTAAAAHRALVIVHEQGRRRGRSCSRHSPAN